MRGHPAKGVSCPHDCTACMLQVLAHARLRTRGCSGKVTRSGATWSWPKSSKNAPFMTTRAAARSTAFQLCARWLQAVALPLLLLVDVPPLQARSAATPPAARSTQTSVPQQAAPLARLPPMHPLDRSDVIA